MPETPTELPQPILRDLGNGLILRRAPEPDIEPLIAFFSRIFSPRAGGEIRAILTGGWPAGSLDLFTLVEDTTRGQIVSSLTLLGHTFTYGGIPFGVGRPEWVASDPAYRRRGLIRAQMETIHAWSEARGDKMQVITGIDHYYRQFGYEYALDLEYGRIGFKSYVPRLKEGESEPYRLRPARLDDAPFITQIQTHARRRSLVSRLSTDHDWRALIARSLSDDPWPPVLRIIESAAGVPVGYLLYDSHLRNEQLHDAQQPSNHQILIFGYELVPGISWHPVSLSVLRYLCNVGEELAERENKTFGTFQFNVGLDHPVYEAIHDLLPREVGPYAVYVRLPNLADFVQHIAPVLEQRLAESVMVGHTGQLTISFYRSGLRIAFEAGKIHEVEPWQPISEEGGEDMGMACFPNLSFLQLLLGYRSLEELEYAFKDCTHKSDEARALLRALFPKQMSHVF